MTNVSCSKCHTLFSLEESQKCPVCGCDTFVAPTGDSKVFLLQKDKYNIGSAKDFGEVVWMVEQPLDPFDLSATIKAMLKGLDSGKFRPQKDFIALTGPSNLIAIMLATVIWRYNTVNILLFDPQTSRYRSRRFSSDMVTL